MVIIRQGKQESDKETNHGLDIEERHITVRNSQRQSVWSVNSAHHQTIDPKLGERPESKLLIDDDDEKMIEGLEFADKTNTGPLCYAYNGILKECISLT